MHQLACKLRPLFNVAGIEPPEDIAVSCGWPSKNARRRRAQRIGECWRAECSQAGRPEIFISPVIADPIEVGHVLVHELIHAALPDAGHRPPFKRAATNLGLTGKMTATVPTEGLRRQLAELTERMGEPYPHALLDPGADLQKQSTRLIKLECPACGYVIRTTRKWIEAGVPTCCCGELFEPAV
jgi:hypothetical protein